MADQKSTARGVSTAALLICLFIVFLSPVENVQQESSMHGEEEIPTSDLLETVKRMFSTRTTAVPRADIGSSTSSYWVKARALIDHVQAYFFPPNLDFRGSSEEAEAAGGKGVGGAGEKVKEAVKESLEKSKATVEDSAKSAAEAVHKTAKMMKRSSSDRTDTPPQTEL
ncbi:hypothetical protein RJ639_034752 [Escallonia herrerae]|uniref:Transmembrane protein n=1 Tax=Escallonia herrerae TaxID=1293975 RepID=A0AA88WWL4_9ASTE|nr:hypothetical protein RJ639_034752 [Escallonia herrerae]